MGSQDSLLEPQQATDRAANNWFGAATHLAKREPLATLLLITIWGTVIAFFFVFRLYTSGPIMVWAWKHWLPNLNQEHGKLVIPISLALVWFHRKKLQAAEKQGSNWGLPIILLGISILLVGTRALQPRIS